MKCRSERLLLQLHLLLLLMFCVVVVVRVAAIAIPITAINPAQYAASCYYYLYRLLLKTMSGISPYFVPIIIIFTVLQHVP